MPAGDDRVRAGARKEIPALAVGNRESAASWADLGPRPEYCCDACREAAARMRLKASEAEANKPVPVTPKWDPGRLA